MYCLILSVYRVYYVIVCLQSPFPSGEKWEHVQSLYQNPLASCLYGKNNVMMKPVSDLGNTVHTNIA